MKKLLICSLFIFGLLHFTQAQNWEWAESSLNSSADGNACYTMAKDNKGYIYIAGDFEGYSVTFGSYYLTNMGIFNIFIVKYDSSGNVVWAKSAVNTGNADCDAIAVDTFGNIYMTGTFDAPAIWFGPLMLSNSYGGMFLVKYDSSGNALWAKTTGGNGYASGHGLCTDLIGNVYLSGVIQDTLSFGTYTVSALGYFDFYVAKYDSGGNVLWIKTNGMAGSGSDPNSVVCDGSANIYLTGFYAGLNVFGTDTLHPTVNGNLFVVKYTTSGNLVWATSPIGPGSGTNGVNNICLDNNFNPVITGEFQNPTIIFGNDTLVNDSNGSGTRDIFVVKYDSSGRVLWARSAGGKSNEFGTAIATDKLNNIYVTGNFESNAIIFGSDTLSVAGMENIFVTEYNSSGGTYWAVPVGAAKSDLSYAVAVDNLQKVYIAGSFGSPNISFGSTILTNTTSGGNEAYLAKLDNSSITTGGINSSFHASSYSVFPNPSSGIFNLQANSLIANSCIEVFNVLGEKVFSLLSQKSPMSFDLTGQPNGVYFYRVLGEDGGVKGEGKMVIQK